MTIPKKTLLVGIDNIWKNKTRIASQLRTVTLVRSAHEATGVQKQRSQKQCQA